ncbi:MAG TPA: ATPase, T2SS/T4P/T4SS family [Candidatus Magasanikbacteria bacterium]|nr:ATPase, T2SS/T4P/T4SS family [Candidatus Magasanikbacteria bacterium]
MLSEKVILNYLKKTRGFGKKEIAEYTDKAGKLGKKLEDYLRDENLIDELEMYTKIAAEMDIPFIALKGREIKKDVLELIPASLAQTHDVVAFEKTPNEIRLAMLDPEDIQTIEFIHRKTGLNPKVFLTAPSDIKDALRRYHADLESDISIQEISDTTAGAEGDLKKVAEELPIINIVNSILEHAVFEGASDIHIEPEEKDVIVRYRIDGILRPVMTLPKTVKSGIMARIKVLANLKIDEHMRPQDGRFKIQVQDEKLSFRVSIIPVYDGEKVVMRLLHEGQKPLTLDELGFAPIPKKIVESAIKKPHGMILVTGPTGSGKTTTLYSVLGMLNKPNVNISTIEDPIEYHIKGINQSQTNPQAGFTFANGLRAFLRQDPNIIMVGEIRDGETAEIAIHAAMTGHLVLSTLHTNDAPTTIPRLADMNIPPFLIAFTANIIVAQRLVRKICPHCRKEIKLETEALADMEKITKDANFKLAFGSIEGEVKKIKSFTDFKNTPFFRGEGCRRCNNSGYKGRVGIYEVMEISKNIIDKINARANAEELKKIAHAEGMITMLEDGLIKCKTGVTTVEEILRVVRD